METQAVEIIKTEVVLEDAKSLNHARLIGRLTVLLSAYEDWLVVPSIKTIHLFSPGQPVTTIATGILHDPATGIDLAVEKLFR